MVASPEPLVGAFGGVGVSVVNSATPRLISLRSRSNTVPATGPCRVVSTTSVAAPMTGLRVLSSAAATGGGEGGGAQRQPSAMEVSCG